MATIPLTLTRAEPYADAWVATWTVSTGDDGAPVKLPQANDRSVQVTGTFATSTVVLQGSNDGSTWVTLNNPQGTAVSFTAAGLMAIQEHTRYMRPLVTGGTGTGLVVTLFAKGQMV